MTQVCHKCGRKNAVIHCVTEAQNFCLTCDYLRHYETSESFLRHIRYQLCDKCMINPALLFCSDQGMVFCQSCYTLNYSCTTDAYRLKVMNQFHQQHHKNHIGHGSVEPHMPGVFGYSQRREGMFEMSCNGNNNCERWMFAMNCEECLLQNAVVYCELEDQLLCNNCDRLIHQTETVPPHMRSVLCVTCKRVSHNFVIGGYQFSLPTTTPPAASEEVSPAEASPSSGPSHQDSNFS